MLCSPVLTEAYSEPCQTPKMERIVKIVNDRLLAVRCLVGF